ncbi:L,D-transpeptidase [Pseudahrensia aquimaris]|uniref:L,D-transpeptidase n=1 Tax=Pseudahrensia aquimaris TaxID=744461 RepID=A0ABW3FIW2_9HYPH
MSKLGFFRIGRGLDLSRTAASIFVLSGVVVLQACSSSQTLTSAYAPPTSPSVMRTAAVHAGKADHASFVARDQAYAARPEPQTFDYPSIYAAKNDDGIQISAFDYTKMSPRYLRQQVRYFGPERPGTIVIDAKRKHLYLVERNGMAMRYGIAVGKEGYGWTGNSVLQWKQKWPTWTPPKEMIERKPELAKYAEGLKGSPANPLGARAMYLFKNGKDTLYRIHGTDKPFSIGKAASSGCFRMINQDVIDLYDRVNRKASVQVRTQVAQNLVQESSR